ncbi:PH domain-containing protein [Paenalkalicoccus suaedae]|uniref:PH domain-containing protein n=1 Tax=Paenalkalicoccus suaedae TaxID=2592382 RepID=A0A859FCR0_9BACI|nr:PH domain-containing protein [Paenalkalicoccus suaedae]QKS70006.1 PH domain-containing protein [Paenalkalicoccus suaedae]
MNFFKGDNKSKHHDQVQEFLFEGEELHSTYGLMVDFVALTSHRVLFVDRSIMSKSRSVVVTIPFSKIEEIAIEKTGFLSFSNTIEIATKSGNHQLQFTKGSDVMGFYKELSQRICA